MTLGGGIYYAENGFLSNAGLQYRCTDEPLLSWQKKRELTKSDCFTRAHYPQLQAWIAGLLVKIIGKEKIYNGELHYYRFFPVTIGIISLILFAYMIVSNFGIIKATIIIAAVSTIGMTSHMMPQLGWHGYIFPLFFLQVGIYFYIFKKEEKFRIKYYIILFILGFLQGWLSFDWFFLVSFSAIPFALLYSHINKGEIKKRLLYSVLFPLFGFGFAHFFHFIQFAVYYGSIADAFNDFFSIAKYRINGNTEHVKFQYEGLRKVEIGRIELLNKYMNYHVNVPEAFGRFVQPFKKFLMAVFFLTLFKDVRINIKRPVQASLKWTSSNRTSLSIIAAFLISILWLVVMKQFSSMDFFIIYITRHFFLIYFVCILTLVESLSLENIPITKHMPEI